MLVFGGVPVFYMELALGQFQRVGCLTVWKRLCPLFKGAGYAIVVMASYVAFYYNTIIAWALYYFFSSMRLKVPWISCDNDWNTDNCTSFEDRKNTSLHTNYSVASSEEFYSRQVLESFRADGLSDVGGIKWSIALCLAGVFVLVYFALWKGVKSSGKAVWVTATLPYLVLTVLMIRGCTLPGSHDGIVYYLTPQWEQLKNPRVWVDAAAQVFFSLGPGFGVLLALSSYNKFNNNCYRDAIITSGINCFTSFFAGFAVFSVLGFMSNVHHTPIDEVAGQGPGLIFVAYPEAISTLDGSVFWAIIFFIMLITLGLDTTFGGLESVITGVLDEWPALRKRRELFVLVLIIYCFLGGLSTTTYGGRYVVELLDSHAAPFSILLVVFLEIIAVSWIYGVRRFSGDVEAMLGFRPGIFWQVCWTVVSPVLILLLFVLSFISYNPPLYGKDDPFPDWAVGLGWMISASSLVCIPSYMFYRLVFVQKGSLKERITQSIVPEEVPKIEPELPVYL
ncbi:sodium-dependent serotonin transporter-like [Liolophura sinensis]|uniref:sodium-dependent serotonin transporter-like n=1 Tax=Liolophura sinensis TaxID=3198878 RepID=UPI003158B42F